MGLEHNTTFTSQLQIFDKNGRNGTMQLLSASIISPVNIYASSAVSSYM